MLKDYRPFFVFLFRFFSIYILFLVIYQLFLNYFPLLDDAVDYITYFVSLQVQWCVNLTGHELLMVPYKEMNSMFTVLDGYNSVQIIEGCNAVSLMVLFVSFVGAFYTNFKKTVLFSVFGVVFIHLANVFRIVMLIFLIRKFPSQTRFWHDIFFPIVVYGAIFLLWIIWLRIFMKYHKKEELQVEKVND